MRGEQDEGSCQNQTSESCPKVRSSLMFMFV